MVTRLLILGAAGRDFHDYNMAYRGNPDVTVIGFTATQIPDIAGRRYPASLAGPQYPEGIPIFEEADLERLIAVHGVDEVVFAYSDVGHEHVMHLAARTVAAGAAFRLHGGDDMMLSSSRPVVSITATRTGTGKSQTSRKVRAILATAGKRVAAIRHPMPYGDLEAQRVQRFATAADLAAAQVTIEEREEYEPYLEQGAVIFAGVDYAEILRAAEAEADVIVWDGGNNDVPFVRPDIDICVVDPFRAGHELRYWPGEVNVRRAGVIVINKVDTAPEDGLAEIRRNIAAVAPDAVVIEAASPPLADDPSVIAGRRVLVIEDGPTITHGEMAFGAGSVAARAAGAVELIDARPFAVGSIARTYEKYTHIGPVLPAMGYSDEQRAELQATIAAAEPEAIVIGTPIDFASVIDLGDVPRTRVRYELEEIGSPTLVDVLEPLTKG